MNATGSASVSRTVFRGALLGRVVQHLVGELVHQTGKLLRRVQSDTDRDATAGRLPVGAVEVLGAVERNTALAKVLGIERLTWLAEAHAEWIEAALRAGEPARVPEWSESLWRSGAASSSSERAPSLASGLGMGRSKRAVPSAASATRARLTGASRGPKPHRQAQNDARIWRKMSTCQKLTRVPVRAQPPWGGSQARRRLVRGRAVSNAAIPYQDRDGWWPALCFDLAGVFCPTNGKAFGLSSLALVRSAIAPSMSPLASFAVPRLL